MVVINPVGWFSGLTASVKFGLRMDVCPVR